MANLYNNNNEETKGFDPKADATVIKAKNSTFAKVAWWIIIGFLCLIIVGIVIWVRTNNKLKRDQMAINEVASGIDIALTRRQETLTKLLDATKGYIEYEKGVLENVTKLRAQKVESANWAGLDSGLSNAFGKINVALENYPDLKASNLVKELTENAAYLENELAASRRLYNRYVTEFNQEIFTWPKSVHAENLGLETFPVFKASEKQRQDVELKF